MITLDDHHGGKPRSPVCEGHTRSETATAVSDAIANLERALVAAGNAPGTFGLILGNGAVYVNEPVVMRAAQDLVNRGKIVATSQLAVTTQKLFDETMRLASVPGAIIKRADLHDCGAPDDGA